MIEKKSVLLWLLFYFLNFILGVGIDAFTAESFNRNEWISNLLHVWILLTLHMMYTITLTIVHQTNQPWFTINNFNNVEQDAVVGNQSNGARNE